MKSLKEYQYKDRRILAHNKPEAAFKFLLFTTTEIAQVRKVGTINAVRKMRKKR